jgi:LacI family transcriptional regulator
MKPSKITITDVARLAGVSKRTVSRVINDSPKVGKQTRARIKKIIDDLGYSPDVQARGLATRRSYLLGLIYDRPDAFYIDKVLRGILSVCREAGFELVVHPCERDSRTLTNEALSFVSRSNLDGVIVLPPISENDRLARALEDAHVRYVRLASIPVDKPEHVVISNERVAVAEMTKHLIQLGHRRIGYITGPKGLISTRERLEGYRQALAEQRIEYDDDLVARGDYSFESGLRCSLALLDRKPRPTAIFASNDEMAVGVIDTARNLGLGIPADLSVAGFDDSILASRINPALTTIRRPVREMAQMAASKLIAAIDGREEDARIGVILVPSLVERETTRALD